MTPIISNRPLAPRGEDEGDVRERAEARIGHDSIAIHSYEVNGCATPLAS